MLNWAKAHPIWATVAGLFLLFVVWMLFFRSSGDSSATSGISTVTQDPSAVAAGQQLQALQIQGQFQTQQAQLAADVNDQNNATQIALAQLAAQMQSNQTDQQAAVAQAQIAAQQHTDELTSTLSAQIAQAQITAAEQNAQLQATTSAQIAAGQNSTNIALAQSQADLMKSIQESNAQVQSQLIASNAGVQTAAIKAQPKQSLLSKIGCFITTAYVELDGKPDDCAELQLAREWRDNWLLAQACGADVVALYYECAPRFLQSIATRDDRDCIIKALGHAYIKPFILAIECGENESALRRYIAMLEHIGRHYDETILGDLDAWHGRRSRALMDAA